VHGIFSIIAVGSKSISINFDQFKLPQGTEMFVYSENGEMITGPVAESENNENNSWGSWVYKGEKLTVELKTQVQNRADIKLHISSVAYGYNDIYQSKVPSGNFGTSGSCNVNVLCPAGNGWENERNSVALILGGAGTTWCTGAMVNNTGNLTIPYFLTANHCFDGAEANWKFSFMHGVRSALLLKILMEFSSMVHLSEPEILTPISCCSNYISCLPPIQIYICCRMESLNWWFI
jgi:lysyl endopeptidase